MYHVPPSSTIDKGTLFRLLTSILYVGKVTYKGQPCDGKHEAIAEVPFMLRPPVGERSVRLRLLPSGKPLTFTTGGGGSVRATVRNSEAHEVLCSQVINHLLLLAVHPAGEGDQEEGPWFDGHQQVSWAAEQGL